MQKSADRPKLPLAPPPFTLQEVRAAIPQHCFDRSALRSAGYVAVDFLLIGVMFYLASYIWQFPLKLQLVLWPVYWFAQGVVFTGIWVCAHECGHQSFSKWKIVNDSVGLVLHSLLLVPYHSWRISHGNHHKSTSHMDRDQVYVPKTHSQITVSNGEDLHNLVSDAPLVNLMQIVLMLLVGWPAYLVMNAWGQNYGKRTNHFEPSSPIFKKEHFLQISLSDLGIAMMLVTLYSYGLVAGWGSLVFYYVMPYLWCNFWLVLITYLQHTDVVVPHFRGEEWNFLRGALCTVDRDYGILNHFFHHIGDTHVAHHLFSTMPHYHAQEATEAVKKFLGSYYLSDTETPILTALWRSWNQCHYVEDKGDVLFYQTVNFDAKKSPAS